MAAGCSAILLLGNGYDGREGREAKGERKLRDQAPMPLLRFGHELQCSDLCLHSSLHRLPTIWLKRVPRQRSATRRVS